MAPWTVSGTTWVSQYQKGKTRKVKPIGIYCPTQLLILSLGGATFVINLYNIQGGPKKWHTFQVRQYTYV